MFVGGQKLEGEEGVYMCVFIGAEAPVLCVCVCVCVSCWGWRGKETREIFI